MSRHSTPASDSADCAAATPYSTKFSPHLPHGCMPTPRIAMSLSLLMISALGRWPGRSGPARCSAGSPPPDAHSSLRRLRGPLPHDVLVLIVFVERTEHEFHF